MSPPKKASNEPNWIEEEEVAPCSLLLELFDLETDFSVLSLPSVAGVIAASAAITDELTQACSVQDKVLIVRNDVQKALKAGGLHLSRAEGCAVARAKLHKNSLLGAECRTSKHDAMVAGEADADYVMFRASGNVAELCDLVSWWSELFVLPCAVAGEFTLAEAIKLKEAGAGFLVLPVSSWQDASLMRDLDALLCE